MNDATARRRRRRRHSSSIDPVPKRVAVAKQQSHEEEEEDVAAIPTKKAKSSSSSSSVFKSVSSFCSKLQQQKQQVALVLSVGTLLLCSSLFFLFNNNLHLFLREHHYLAQQKIRYWTLRLAVTTWLTKSIWDWQRVKRRQAIDATSEWSRYASRPAARGRALMALIVPVSLQYMFLKSRILLWWLPKRWKQAWLRRSGQFLCTGLLQLGPLYIKLGQIVSCRENLLPTEWIAALEKLQDQVPAQTGKQAWELALSVWPMKNNNNNDDVDSENDNSNSSTTETSSSSSATTTSSSLSSSSFKSFHDTFAEFDDVPLAAASLGQVHHAVLKGTGDPVAIKLQRPFLREMYDQDFSLLTKFAASVDALSARLGSIGGRRRRGDSSDTASSSVGSVGGIQQNWTSIFEDAEEILYREIDYRDEAENTIRFCKGFGLAKDGVASRDIAAKSLDGKPLPSAAPWLRAPYVYDDLSSEKALVMEYVPSIKITRTDKLREAGVTDEDRVYLADCLARSYLRQFCCNYFFSTDPHAGNLGVEILDLNRTKPEDRVRLVFYDFGQAASLKPMQGEGILEIVEAIVDMDVDRSMESFEKMGVLKPNADLDKVRSKIADNFRTGKVKANRKRLKKRGYKFKKSSRKTTSTANTTSTATTGSDAEVMKFFTLPAEYAFVGRALSQMDGVGKVLDPEFDFVSAAAPWIYEIKGATLYLQEEALKWLENTKKKICKLMRIKKDGVKR